MGLLYCIACGFMGKADRVAMARSIWVKTLGLYETNATFQIYYQLYFDNHAGIMPFINIGLQVFVLEGISYQLKAMQKDGVQFKCNSDHFKIRLSQQLSSVRSER